MACNGAESCGMCEQLMRNLREGVKWCGYMRDDVAKCVDDALTRRVTSAGQEQRQLRRMQWERVPNRQTSALIVVRLAWTSQENAEMHVTRRTRGSFSGVSLAQKENTRTAEPRGTHCVPRTGFRRFHPRQPGHSTAERISRLSASVASPTPCRKCLAALLRPTVSG
eukprot:6205441-Pleurochrysis_carterae.AAC.3